MSIGLLWVYARHAGRFMLEKGMLPGGLTRLDAVLAGAKEGSSGAYRDDVVVEGISPNGRLQTRIIPKDDGGLYTDAALIQMGLERARMLPHSAASGFRSAPTQIHAAYKPISDLGRTAADAFRRGTLPRVTGLEGQPTVGELIQDAINGAKVGVASLPNPLGPPPPYRALGGLLGWLGAQIWGYFNRKPDSPRYPQNTGQIDGPFGNWGGTVNKNGYVSGRFSCSNGSMTEAPWKVTANQGIGATGSYGIKWETRPFWQHTKCGGTTNTKTITWVASYKRTTPDGPWVLQSSSTDSEGETRANFGFDQFTQYTPELIRITLDGVEQPLPTTGEPIDRKVPSPAPLPQLPPNPGPAPAPSPAPQPEPEPLPEPDNPNPAKVPVAPPVTAPGRPGTTAPPLPGQVVVINPDGTMPAPVPLPPGVTDPDWHFPIPGGKPIPGNGPQPKPEEIAKELGRIEQKLNTMLSPRPDNGVEWQKWLQMLFEAMFNSVQGTSYTLTEKCAPCDGSTPQPQTVTVNAPGAFTELGVIENRIDALAQLIDAQLGLKQVVCPPCKPQLTGEWVTVNFVSYTNSPDGDRPLRKRLRYRDQTSALTIDHVLHWESFEWDAGPVMVASKNLSWGTPQVWAASAAEGKRVISHAAAIAGVDLSNPAHQWVVSGSSDPRYGKPGRMRVDDRGGQFIRVTKRPGPSGLPTGVAPIP